MVSVSYRKPCYECPLGQRTDLISNCIPGDGPALCDLLFVGEAPGAEEDKNGRPFQGRAGKKLKECLEEAGLQGYKIRFTNTNRCRPKDNAKPTAADSEACRHYLLEEIEETKPKVIVLGGNIAMRLLGSGYRSVTKERGSVLKWNEHKVVITVHPAYVLRKWEDTVLLVSDLKLAKKVIDGTDEIDVKRDYRVIQSLEAMEVLTQRLENAYEFSFDIESTGFDWRTEPILCIGFCDIPGESFVVPLKGQIDEATEEVTEIWSPADYQIVLSCLRRIFKSKAIKSSQNGKFDMKFLWRNGIEVDLSDFDTILAHHLIDENIPLNLEFLANYYLGWERWDKNLKSFIPVRKTSYGVIPNKVLWKYNAHDPDATLRLKHLFQEQIPEEDFDANGVPTIGRVFRTISIPMQRALMHMEMCGVYIDREKVDENATIFARRLEEIETKIFKVCRQVFKLGSTKQLGKVLFGPSRWYLPITAFQDKKANAKKQWIFENPGLALPPTEITEAGNITTKKDALEEHAQKLEQEKVVPQWKIDVLKDITSYRNVRHWKNTFIDGADGDKGLKRWIREDSRLYPNYIQFGTDTGRLACFVPGTKVRTIRPVAYSNSQSRGRWQYTPIEELVVGDKVYTHQGRTRQVTETMRRWVDEDIVKIFLGGKKVIRVTDEHPILTPNGWTPAGDLKTEDILHTYKDINLKYAEGVKNNGKYATPESGGRSGPGFKGMSLDEYYDDIDFSTHVKAKAGNGSRDHRPWVERYGPEELEERRRRHTPVPSPQEGRVDINAEILERANRRCMNCGSTQYLNVHHVGPVDLVVVCATCHSRIHRGNLESPKPFHVELVISNGIEVQFVKRERYVGWVYNLEVEEDHSYLVEGIVAHNCREPNLMNIPRDADLRAQFAAPEGWVFVEADYSQVENRVIAILSGAARLLEAMRNGLDIHTNAATIFFRVPYEDVTKDMRDHAKFVTHGLNYGRSIPSIAQEHGMSILDTTAYVRNYFELAPEQAKWMLGQFDKVKRGDIIIDAYGRQRHLPKDARGHEQRQALNSPVQGTAAEILAESTIKLYERFEREGLWWDKVKMTMSLHDALFFEIRKDALEEVVDIIIEEMERPIPELDDYKFPVEVTAGHHWKDKDGVVLYKGVGGYVKDTSVTKSDERSVGATI